MRSVLIKVASPTERMRSFRQMRREPEALTGKTFLHHAPVLRLAAPLFLPMEFPVIIPEHAAHCIRRPISKVAPLTLVCSRIKSTNMFFLVYLTEICAFTARISVCPLMHLCFPDDPLQ